MQSHSILCNCSSSLLLHSAAVLKRRFSSYRVERVSGQFLIHELMIELASDEWMNAWMSERMVSYTNMSFHCYFHSSGNRAAFAGRELFSMYAQCILVLALCRGFAPTSRRSVPSSLVCFPISSTRYRRIVLDDFLSVKMLNAAIVHCLRLRCALISRFNSLALASASESDKGSCSVLRFERSERT